jgi:hypothetical protein
VSDISTAQGFRADDIVFVGPAEDLATKTTWKILSLWQAADDVEYATVVSGLSGIIRSFPVAKLTPFSGVERVVEPA